MTLVTGLLGIINAYVRLSHIKIFTHKQNHLITVNGPILHPIGQRALK